MAKFTASIQINAVSNLSKVTKKIAKNTEKLRKSFSKLGKAVKKAGEQFAKFAKRAAFAVTGLVIAMGVLIKKTADYGDDLDKTSQKTGIAVENLQRLRLAAKLGGGSFRDLDTGMKVFARAIDEAGQGTAEYLELFQRLRVPVKDFNGRTRDQLDLLNDVADRFRDMTREQEKSAVAQQLFGRGGLNLIPMLNQGSDAIEEIGKRLHDVFTEEDAKRSAAFNDEIAVLSTNISILTKKALLPALPILQRYITMLDNSLPNIRAWVGEHVNFEAIFKKIEEILRNIDLKKVFDVSLTSVRSVLSDLRTILDDIMAIRDTVKSVSEGVRFAFGGAAPDIYKYDPATGGFVNPLSGERMEKLLIDVNLHGAPATVERVEFPFGTNVNVNTELIAPMLPAY
jgi:hypothetical protein